MKLALRPDVNRTVEMRADAAVRGCSGIALSVSFDMMPVRDVLFCAHPFPSRLLSAAHSQALPPPPHTPPARDTGLLSLFITNPERPRCQTRPPSNAADGNQSSALDAGLLSMRSVAPSVQDISLPLICLTS